MRGAQEKHLKQAEVPTPYRVMRMQNCKAFTISLNSKSKSYESYPSIRPPIDKCFYEKTTMWMADTVKASGCKGISPDAILKSNKNPYTEALRTTLQKVNNKKVDNYCKDRTPNRANARRRKMQDRALDWSMITPYNLMRLENSKASQFSECETYPTIRPPLFKCCPQMTADALYDAVEDVRLERPFDMEHDDILEIWKRAPKKETLSFYGIASRIYKPEAVVFNQLLSECVKIAGKPNREITTESPVSRKTTKKQRQPLESPCGMILNRTKLHMKVLQMPTVLKKLNQQSTTNWKYCPVHKKSYEPFIIDPLKFSPVSLEVALDMEKPAEEEKHGLRRKHSYCELICGIPENKCTEYEARKSPLTPEDYKKSYMELKQTVEFAKPEPKNYDELYDELITCFVRKPCDPDMKKLLECCSPDKGGEDNDGSYISDGGDGDKPHHRDVDKPHHRKIIKDDTDDGKGDKDDGKDHRKRKDVQKGDGKGEEYPKVPSTVRPKTPPKAQPDESPLIEIPPMEPPMEEIPPMEQIPPPMEQIPPKPKRQPKKKKPSPPDNKDCPCEKCDMKKKGGLEPDSPLITQLKREEERRKLKEYLKILCCRQKGCVSRCCAPLRKCDEIECDDCFCCDPKLHDYCECLNALQELQNLLGPIDFPELRSLKDRISARLCESL